MQHSHDRTNSHHCPACDYGHFTRNNYFTGKLLVERDFTDEQRYYVDKLRHHQQRLHGWGVVCGLKVKPHDSEACRDRFVCIEPGSAIDCCGHDIIVRAGECVDLWQFPEIKKLQQEHEQGQGQEPAAHKLQICVRYRECPTEEIPVLYDDCGCDDTQCAPNRILESHEFGVILDAADDLGMVHTPRLKWENSVSIAHANRVALHDETHRLYVVSADSPATVDQVSTDNHAKITSRSLPTEAIALAVSKDGSRLYVVTEPVAPATLQRLHVLKTETALPTLSEMDVPGSTNSDVNLAVAADGRLYALVATTGDLLRFDADLDINSSSAAPTPVHSFGANVRGPVLSNDGKQAFAVGPNDQIQQIKDIDGPTPTIASITLTPALPAGSDLSSLAIVDQDLVVAEQTTRNLRVIGLGTTPALKATVPLDHDPIDLVASPAGHWIYVLERDAAGSFVQAVSVVGIQKTPPHKPGTPLRVGDESREVVISKSARHLYIPFVDDLADPALGGVAVVDVSEEACDEILWRDLEGCTHCDQPNCIVLATIENYHFGDKILAQIEPPEPTDAANHIARISNRLGRRLLPSTQILTDVVQCLLEHQGEAAAVGPKGDKGETGAAGTGAGITDVTLQIVRCAIEESAQIVTEGDKTTLELVIPTICDRDLAQIAGINWRHAQDMPLASDITKNGLLIAFSHPVIKADLHNQSVMVLAQQTDQKGMNCWCEVPGRINAIKFDIVGDVDSAFKPNPGPKTANGIQFLPTPETPFADGTYRVVVKGDFIRDAASEKAIDADHLPPWLGSQVVAGRKYRTGDGVAGGTFESWFTFKGQ